MAVKQEELNKILKERKSLQEALESENNTLKS